VAGDPREAVGAWLQQHPLEDQPVGGMLISAPGNGGLRRPQPLCQVITDPLQLADIQQAGLRAMVTFGKGDAAHRERGEERVGKLTLK
jgi:hypothetical protein